MTGTDVGRIATAFSYIFGLTATSINCAYLPVNTQRSIQIGQTLVALIGLAVSLWTTVLFAGPGLVIAVLAVSFLMRLWSQLMIEYQLNYYGCAS